MSNTQTEPVRISDVLKWECNRNFTREKAVLTAVGGATAGLAVGNILQGGSAASIIAAGGTVTSILLEPVTLAEYIAGCSKVVLVRGPAIVDTDRLTCNSSYKATALVTLAGLGIIVSAEPTELQEGTEVES